MPRVKKKKKTFTIAVEATVTINASYEIEAYTLDEAQGEAEDAFENEFDVWLKEPSDCGFDIQDINSEATEEEE